MTAKHCNISVPAADVLCTARVKGYPNGRVDTLICDRAIFGGKGWELSRKGKVKIVRKKNKDAPSDVERSIRRARAQVRDIALCTPFKYFVTLTLDKEKVDRYDMTAITKKLNNWLDNQVRRHGLAYVLVPERHKDGAVHFHGFFNDALTAVDSGTISMGSGKPMKPRSGAERDRLMSQGGHVVYNLPAWSMGFTTAIELYGDYDQAVSYVCKYIGKEGASALQANDGGDKLAFQGKLGGRWYYSGGALGHPEVLYAAMSIREWEHMPGAYRFDVPKAGLSFLMFTQRPEKYNHRPLPLTPVSGKIAPELPQKEVS